MSFLGNFREFMYDNNTVGTLRIIIIVTSLAFIAIALLVNNPWILAGAAAYQLLP